MDVHYTRHLLKHIGAKTMFDVDVIGYAICLSGILIGNYYIVHSGRR